MASSPSPERPPHPAFSWLLLIALFAAGVWSFSTYVLFDSRVPIDFMVYVRAVQALESGHSVYDPEIFSILEYIYPQLWAFLLLPLVRVAGVEGAERVFSLINGACFAFIIAAGLVLAWRTVRSLPQPPSRRQWTMACVAGIALGLGASPSHYGFRLNQLDLLLTALVAMPLVLEGRWRLSVGGVCFGIAVMLKPSPLLLAPAFGLAFGWAFVGWALVPAAVYLIALAGGGLLGEEARLWREVLPFHTWQPHFPSHSLYRLLFREWLSAESIAHWYGGGPTRALQAAVLAGYACLGMWLWWKRAGVLALVATGIAFSHWASPYLEPHHYTNSLLVIIPAAAAAIVTRDRALGILAGTCGAMMYAFLPLMNSTGRDWPAYMLLLTDVFLVAIACLRPHLGGGPPAALTLPLPRRWREKRDGMA